MDKSFDSRIQSVWKKIVTSSEVVDHMKYKLMLVQWIAAQQVFLVDGNLIEFKKVTQSTFNKSIAYHQNNQYLINRMAEIEEHEDQVKFLEILFALC